MATIYIDNKPYQVKDGQNLLHACLSLGFNIPYFCWHPAMHSVGACRQCAVKQFKDEKDMKGKIVMSCMTPAADGTRISIDDPEAKKFRASVIEWLMLNHPHDCPVCDEGGECHLQDMTVMAGHDYRRTRFRKRTYRNQYLGPFVNHEMNRCIQCYRCVRFYRDHAGGRDLNVFASHNHVYFGRQKDGALENEFSGNLVEICPTGVFTDKSLKKHYTRKWDLQTAPSICVFCGLGCNTIPAERYGIMRRVLNRFNGEVNGYFLCDRGRFGYEFVNDRQRIKTPLVKNKETGAFEAASREEALEQLSQILYFGAKVIGIGSPRASLESNFALRTLVGPERFFSFNEREHQLISAIVDILKGPAKSPSISDIADADAIFILGDDVTNTAPLLALAVRQSVRQKPMESAAKLKIPLWDDSAVREVIQDQKGPLFIASVRYTKLDDVATETYHASPDDLARLGFAVAHELDPGSPSVPGLKEDVLMLAQGIACALKNAKRPVIISGMSSGTVALLHAAANIAWALCKGGVKAGLCFTVNECNSLGLGLMKGRSVAEAFRLVEEGEADTAIILERDLYRIADTEAVETFFRRCRHVIAVDHLSNMTTDKADVVLPAATFAEADGTLVNSEGRAQRFFKVFVPEGGMRESRRWLADAMRAARRSVSWECIDDVIRDLATEMPGLNVSDMTPPPGFRIKGQKIPRQPHRYSGRTAMNANKDVHEPKPPDDSDSALSFSMEGYEGNPPPSLITHYWRPGWNSVQALNKFQSEVGGPLQGGDPGKRLIDPNEEQEVGYFKDIPAAFEPRSDEFLVVPLYHIFGSEELSMLSYGIAESAPAPYLSLNSGDAEQNRITEKDEVEVVISGRTYRLRAALNFSLPRGVAGLPVGLAGLKGMILPEWGKVRKMA